MAQALAGFQNSTTGRIAGAEWKRLQLVLGACLSPAIAERTATRLFSSPARRARPDSENLLLARARAFRVQGLAAWRWGSGPPVLLVHDWEGRGAELGAFTSPLVERGFSVVAFDAPAHGASPGLRANVGDFANAVTVMSERIGAPRAIIAHSLGAIGSLLAVQRGVPTSKLVLIAPSSPTERLHRFQNDLDVPADILNGVRHRVERRVGATFDDIEGTSLARGLTIPGLVVHDGQDREVSVEVGDAIARAWRGAALHRTEGLGHRHILSDEGVVNRVADFVAQGESEAARPLRPTS